MIERCGRLSARLVAGALALAVAAGAPAVARADEPASDPGADRAEALGDEAYRAFGEGRYQDAAALYERAYAAAPAARFLLNLADLYEGPLDDRARAAAYYARYVAAPDAEPELVLRARLRLGPTPASVAAPKPDGAPLAPLAPLGPIPPARTATPLRTWGFIAGGAGLGALALGAILGLVARSKNDEASRSCVGRACSDPRALTLTDEAAGFATAANVAFVAGGVLTLGGVALVVLSPPPPPPAPSAASSAFAPSPHGLALSGRFR